MSHLQQTRDVTPAPQELFAEILSLKVKNNKDKSSDKDREISSILTIVKVNPTLISHTECQSETTPDTKPVVPYDIIDLDADLFDIDEDL